MTTKGSPASRTGLEGDADGLRRGRAVLRALVLADLVDSTRVVEVLGDRRASELFARHDRRARELIERFDGVEIDKTDGFFLLFQRPMDAVRFAVAYHGVLEELSSEVSDLPDLALRARVGVHLGEVYLRENAPEEVARGAKPIEAEGLSKPLTARLMSLAGAGQTLLTASAFELAKRSSQGDPAAAGLRWVEHGLYRFQGVAEPVEVFEVGVAGKAPLTPPPRTLKAWPADEGAARRPPWARLGWRWPVAALVLVAAVATGLALWRSPSASPVVAEQGWIVVGELHNLTHQQVFEDALGQALRVGLEQSPFFHVLPESQVRRTLERMKRDPETPLDQELGLEVCEREGASALVLGSIAEIGGGFELTVQILQPPTGAVIAVETGRTRREEQILDVLDGLSRKVRARLGESLPSIETHSEPLEQVTTSDLEALRAYSLALRELARDDPREAADLLRQAIRRDDEFAAAHARLGTVAYYFLGDEPAAVSHWNRALELADRLSEKERLYVEGSSAWLGPPSALRRPWYLLSTLYPEETSGHANLGFVEWWYERSYEAAARAFERCTGTKDPSAFSCWYNHGYCLLALGRTEEALESFEKGWRESENPWFGSLADGYLAASRYDDDARFLAEHVEPPETTALAQIWLKRVDYHVDRGELDQALREVRDLLARLEGSGEPQLLLQARAAEVAVLEGLGRREELLALLGRVQTKRLAELADSPPGRRFFPSLDLALLAKVSVRNGDVERGRKSLRALRGLLDGIDSPLAKAYLGLLEGEILLAEGRPGDAVETLERSSRGVTVYQTHESLARAHEAAGDLEAAGAEDRWLREHRGLAFAEWTGRPFGRELHLLDWAEAAFDLGRLAERSGDLEGARGHYRALLDHWSSASPPPPLFRAAEARLRELEGAGAVSPGASGE